jgi:hypothetical protein
MGSKQPDENGIVQATDEEIFEEMRRKARVIKMYRDGAPAQQSTAAPAAAQPAATAGVAATIDRRDIPVEVLQDPNRTWKIGDEEFTFEEFAVAAQQQGKSVVDFMLSKGVPVTRQQSQPAAAAGGPAPAAAAPTAAMPTAMPADPAGPPLPQPPQTVGQRIYDGLFGPAATAPPPPPAPAMPEGPSTQMVSDDEMKRRQRLVPATSFVTKWFLSNPDRQFISRVPEKATFTAAELVAIAVQTNTPVDEVYAKYVDVKAERQRGRASRPPL